MTNEDHNRYIAYIFFANAGFYFLLMFFVIALFWAMSAGSPPGAPGPPPEFFVVMMAFFGFVYSIFALPSIIAGYALLKKKSWARTASIVAGIIAGMNMPIGTAACVYALWFFFSDNWKEVYPEEWMSPPQERKKISYGVESQRAAYAEEEHQPKFDPYNPPDWR